jgi:phosphoserine phosphatase RsbU/P
VVLLYRLGATESFNDAGEEFGERRLVEAFRCHRGQPSQALIALIVEEVRRFHPSEQQDDITLIVAHCRDPKGSA